MEKQKKTDILLSNQKIKELIKFRINEEGLTLSELQDIAKDLGVIGITKSNLSRYLKYDEPVNGCISQKHLTWLCDYLNIKIIIDAKI